MATVLLLTASGGSAERVLPVFALLPHRVRVAPLSPAALVDAAEADVLVLDART